MNRILLDTHALLWWLMDSDELGQHSRALITNPANEVYVSAASVWEIGIKQAIGKLKAPSDIDEIAASEGFTELAMSAYHAKQAALLPAHHNDPFDRMLIAQAQAEGLTILTADGKIKLYGVQLQDARK